jgi:hypothetical protein
MTKPYQFEPLIDRDRLQKHLEDLHARRTELKAELEKLNRASEAATAYMDVWEGKTRHAAPQAEPRTSTGKRSPRGEQSEPSGFRKEVYGWIRANGPQFSNQVSAHFNPSKDDKIQSQINAALFNLKKKGWLTQGGRNAQYAVVDKIETKQPSPTEPEPPPEPSDDQAA